MDIFLKKFLRKRIQFAFLVTLLVVAGGFFFVSSVQAQTCASLGGVCGSGLCGSNQATLNGQCASEEICCGPISNGGPLIITATACGSSGDGSVCRSGSACPSGDTRMTQSCESGSVCCLSGPATSTTTCRTQGGICEAANTGCGAGRVSRGICTAATSICCVSVGPTSSNSTPITFTNPLQYGTVEEVLSSILSTLQGIIVILSLIFIVIGAILYITSAGNDKQMTMAKSAITASMIGLAIGLAAPSFLKEIGTVLGWGAVNNNAVIGAQTLSQIARSVLDFLLSIVGVLAIIMLVVGGIMYLTAAGNEDQIDSGKKIVKYSIIGIAVALAALVIVSQIANFFI